MSHKSPNTTTVAKKTHKNSVKNFPDISLSNVKVKSTSGKILNLRFKIKEMCLINCANISNFFKTYNIWRRFLQKISKLYCISFIGEWK